MRHIFLRLVAAVVLCGLSTPVWAAPEIHLWFPAEWQGKTEAVEKIAAELAKKSGMNIVPKIARSYPEIMSALAEKSPELAYVGSMVSAVLWSRHLAQPIFQAVDGKHFYSGVMLVAKGKNPETILQETPNAVAFAAGASSGEVAAKAATGGKAAMAVASHSEAAKAVVEGRAKAAFVKNYWWDEHKAEFPGLELYRLPGISEEQNPDHLMLASKSVAPEIKGEFFEAAFHNPELFGANFVTTFDSSSLDFTLAQMKKAGLDPLTYIWPE